MEKERFIVELHTAEDRNVNWYVTDQGTSLDFLTPMRGVRVFITQDRRLAVRYSGAEAINIVDVLSHAVGVTCSVQI